MQIFYKLAQRANLVLDIGANTGVFTLLACVANPNCRVIAFEPVPRVFYRLQENIKINKWDTQCEIRREGVSDTSGYTHIHVPDGDLPTSASLHRQGFRGYGGTLIKVPVTTIDDICLAGMRIDLVKIDVEGFEDKVLKGMQRNLLASTPTIIVECNPDGPFQTVEAMLKMFGYRFFHLRVEGPIAVDKITPDKSGKYRNVLCTVHDDLRVLGLEHS
jgi:FkbM family methyltransferase